VSSVRALSLRLLGLLLLSFALSGCLSFHRGPMPGEPKAATFADIEGTRVRYLDTGGEGEPVVMIHGFASSLETWDAVRPAIEKNRRIIAMDLKGFGWTDRPEGDYSPEAQARLVLGLMTQRGVDRATIVAHSWGASVALAVALMSPERVQRMALYDAWVYEAQLPPFFHWSRAPGVGEALFSLYYPERADERMSLASRWSRPSKPRSSGQARSPQRSLRCGGNATPRSRGATARSNKRCSCCGAAKTS
jgi:pimeloyl-ACP methyl ester carboxylesterase